MIIEIILIIVLLINCFIKRKPNGTHRLKDFHFKIGPISGIDFSCSFFEE